MSDPNDNSPDWPPQSSALGLPEGTQRHGSTGQIWETRDCQWVRMTTIPRAQYKALMGAAQFVLKAGTWPIITGIDLSPIVRALRAAGIQGEE